jgi:adenine deaminase
MNVNGRLRRPAVGDAIGRRHALGRSNGRHSPRRIVMPPVHALPRYIREVPKAELHLHIEGTLEPQQMFLFARRNNVHVKYASVEEVCQAQAFTNLQSFLDLYYEASRVLRTEGDFYDLSWAYLERAAAENVRHAEVFFDPQSHVDRGVPFQAVVGGIHAALARAESEWGMSTRLIMCFLRHLSAKSAMATLEAALPFHDFIVAVGLDSSECDHPPADFVEVFDRARSEGFLTVAHAGEEGPPEYIRQALDLLHVRRIDHGVRCAEDPALVARLAKQRTPLTVCPLSNVRLCVFESLTRHNLKELLDRGLCVTVNSDDPAYFGGYVTENLLSSAQALSLSQQDVYQLERNAFEAAFVTPERRRELIAELDRFTREFIA